MKRLKSTSLGLMAILSISFNFGLIGKALADNKSCKGASCNNKNPVEYRCNSDANVVIELTKTVYRWQDSWQPRKIVVQKIYSEKCHATWTRAYIPDDAYSFLRGRDIVNGNQPIYGLSKANGTGYFWVNGKMSNGSIANQACVALPGIIIPKVGYSYDRYCTDFK
ncbi:MAG: hypothetical protein Fur006_67510 [Coleofasciculaceae cyanobacterium]